MNPIDLKEVNMFKLGKFLIGVAAAGITAATVYNYLEESKKSDVDETKE